MWRGIPGITLPALLKDLKGAAKRLDTIGRLERAALVTDNNWIRMAVPFDDKVMRNVHVRVFRLAQAEEARTWVRSASG